MKALIHSIVFKRERKGKFSQLFDHEITYGDEKKKAYYSSKKKEQTKFKAGEVAEFTEEERYSDKGNFTVIKPIYDNLNRSGYGKKLQVEQSKYSGFAVSYVKDLIVADKIDVKDWEAASKKIFDFMVNLDKSVQK